MHKKPSIKPMFVTLGILACVIASGCSYPEVSPKAYEISKALYSVCNQEKTGRLQIVSDLIDTAVSDGELSEQEGQWLHGIVTQAREGQWKAAASESRKIMEDQIGLRPTRIQGHAHSK